MKYNNSYIVKRNYLFISLLFLLISCTSNKENTDNRDNKTLSVILDTDMGNDIDDALALDMLYKYMDMGRINLLGIMTNKDCKYTPEYIDVMATWYGYPEVPIGILKSGDSLKICDVNYAERASQLQSGGKYVFTRTIDNYNTLPKAEKLYRKILAAQPDSSVIIISIGFLTNLASLLNTPADEYSPLKGYELISKKVKYASVMAGCFRDTTYAEFNVVMDKPSATKFFAEWPSDIVVSPFELGEAIQYPGTSIENDFNGVEAHPMVEGYKVFAEMPYDRPTWDLTSVLYVCEPDSMFFTESPRGIITADSEGHTHFVPDDTGKHLYLTTNGQQQKNILDYFIRLITEKPKKYR